MFDIAQRILTDMRGNHGMCTVVGVLSQIGLWPHPFVAVLQTPQIRRDSALANFNKQYYRTTTIITCHFFASCVIMCNHDYVTL